MVLRGVVVAEEELLCFGWIGQRKGSICFSFFGKESEGSLGIEEERGWTFKYGGS